MSHRRIWCVCLCTCKEHHNLPFIDCDYSDLPNGATCTNYDGSYDDMEGRIWIVILSGIVMCVMSFGVGANDVANSWGTSVGSGAISLRNALILASVSDFLGAVTMGMLLLYLYCATACINT